MRAYVLAVSLIVSVAISAEVPFTPPAYGPAAASQFAASVGSDGDDYLVVWQDQRTFPHEAYATRVSRDGLVLDPTGIRIPAANVHESEVVWTGSSYLVVWGLGGAGRVMATRISREGTILDPPHVLVDDAQAPSAIRAGEWTVVSYLSSSYPHEGRALFLDAEGSIVSRVTIAQAAVDQGPPRIAWNGSQLVAVWSSGGLIDSTIQIKGVRFDSSGALDAQPRTLLATGYNVDPKIASDGSAFVLLTRDYDTSIHRTTPIGADLSAGSPSALPPLIYAQAKILWARTHYVVVAESGYNIRAVRVGRDGMPMDADAVLIESTPPSGSAPAPAVASNGEDLFVAWNASLTAPSQEGVDVYGGLVSPSTFTRRSKSLLSVAATRQSHPIVASSGASLLTMWSESSGLYARRTSLDGLPLDATPIRLGAATQHVDAVFDGNAFLVASLDIVARRVVMLRIPANGELRAEIGTSRHIPSINSVALASNAGVTLLGWTTSESVEATRVASDATWLDDVPLTIASGLTGQVAIAGGDASAFLVTWADQMEICCHGNVIPIAIRGARVTRGLTNLDHDGFRIAATDAQEGDPAATWNGREWLVVWHAGTEIRARRVGANGALLDGTAADPGILLASDAALPRIVWDGARYVLAWLDTPRHDVTSRMHVAWFTNAAIRAGEVIVGDAEGFAISGGVSVQAVAHGRVVAAYARIAREPVYGGVARAFLETIRTIPARRRAVR